MDYGRIPIEIESPEEVGYDNIRNNLSESSIADQSLSDLGLVLPDIKLIYGEHRGSRKLRDLVAGEGKGVSGDDVLITNGAAMALFIIATTLLSAKDHLVVVRPNYGLNLETPRAIGCEVTYLDLSFDEGWRIDLDRLAASLRPNTRLISITVPHNPTGVMCSEAELRAMADLAARHGCRLVVDETYRGMTFGTPLPVAATLGSHVLSVSSMSKTYGLPGTRVGWLVCTDRGLQERFLGAKEQICICGSILDEWIAEQVMAAKDRILEPIMAEMRRRLALVADWIAHENRLEWNRPDGGVVAFVRMKQEPSGGTDAFYDRLMKDHGTYVARGRWFYQPETCFRLGFGWATGDDLEAGLLGISKALRN